MKARGSWKRTLGLVAAAMALTQGALHAQKIAGPFPNEMGTLYLGGGHVLAAIKPRLLTKNANVTEFECAPTGTRVAYMTQAASPDGQDIEQTLGIATVERGDNTVYFHDQVTNGPTLLGLRGWSDDAAYLAFATENPVPYPADGPGATYAQDDLHIVDLIHGSIIDAALPYDQMIPPAGPGEQAPRPLEFSLWSTAWAPGRRLILIGLHASFFSGQSEWAFCLYDPDRNTSQLLFKDENFIRLDGWQDATHLAYRNRKQQHFLYDLATGKTAPVPTAPKLARVPDSPWGAAASASTAPAPNNETLTLAEDSYSLAGQNGVKVDTNAIMLARTGGPAKPASMELDSFPNAFGQGQAQFLQNAGFDRGGVYHVIYESEGDLKVVDLLPRPASVVEKYAAGEKLTCPEEIQIAESDAKQIGLGIMQSVMDNNESFPSGDGFHDTVLPYLKDDSLFTSPNGAGFHYLAPADPKLASMSDPANTPLGEFDLACAKIVLYADGHVQVEQNAPAGP